MSRIRRLLGPARPDGRRTSLLEQWRTTYRHAWRPDTAWINVGFRRAVDDD